MSTACDWCEGAGCDECKPKAKKGGAKAKPAEDAEKCEWCEGAGCDECESKKKMKAKATKGGDAKSPAKKATCDWCEGKGCDECQGKKDTAKDEGGDDTCEWCEGAGCDECGNTGTKKKGGSKKAAACDFCDGAGCEQCADQHGGSAGGELTLDVKIANTFYEAEDLKNEDHKKAIVTYRKVLELTKELPSIADETHTTIFKSMEAIVVLLYKTKQPAEMKTEYKKLLDYIPQVTRNEGSNAIDDVLNAVGGGEFKMLEEMYQITLDVLKKQKDAGRFVFDVGMKQCKAYIDKTQFKKAEEVLERLHMSCRLPDGSDDQKDKCSELIDIYAMKVQLSSLTNSGFEMKDLYERTKDLIKGVVSAKSQGVLRECWGKMFGDDGQWAKAKAEFYQAFTCYQSSGLLNNAKDCLKYAVVANMLSPEEVKEKKDEKKGATDKQKMTSVLDTKEAKQFETQKDVQAIAQLQKAYEKSDVASFMTAATEIGRTADDFIRKHLQSMIREFQGKAIVQLVRAYRRIRLEHIGYQLKITNDEVENLLIQLILDGDIGGVIDQVKGVLDLTQRSGGGGKKYQSLDSLTNAVWRLEEHMEMPITQF